MPPAVDLSAAAAEASNRLQVLWIANTLKPALITFWKATIATFPEEDINSHPVSNWLAVIATIADQMPGANVSYEQLVAAVNAVYRLCWMTSYLQSVALITAAQGSTGPNSILVQYNANF
jgi:hypothetical protein